MFGRFAAALAKERVRRAADLRDRARSPHLVIRPGQAAAAAAAVTFDGSVPPGCGGVPERAGGKRTCGER